MVPSLSQRLSAEFLGTALLLATVIGSGIMGETLSGGNVAVALLANTLATGAILVVLITMLGPISGAHLNPAVTIVFAVRRDIEVTAAVAYILAQTAGAIIGVLVAHAMFDLSIVQLSQKVRSGWGQALSEWVAAFGLVSTILLTVRTRPEAVPTSVGLYITAAYWFTASTSFANPAVTLARAFSDTFAGIRLADVPVFVVVQLAGALSALAVVYLLTGARQSLSSSSARSPAE
jgi:glycerol uptake facilitator-like aquaporin